MGSFAKVPVVFFPLILLACCARLPAPCASEPAALPSRPSGAVAPPKTEALLKGASPRRRRKGSTWHLLKRLPLLVGASRLAGAPFGLDGGRGLGSRARASQVLGLLSPTSAASRRSVIGTWRGAGALWEAGVKRVLPAAIAVRAGVVTEAREVDEDEPSEFGVALGGSAIAEADMDDQAHFEIAAGHEFEEGFRERTVAHLAPSLWEGRPDIEAAIADLRARLLHDGWVTMITTQTTHQLWRFEFVELSRKGGLFIEISFAHRASPQRKLGARFVKLSPSVVHGRLRGFEGHDGFLRYRFTCVGNKLRISMGHPTEGLVESAFLLHATAVTKELITTGRSATPVRELEARYRHNLERLAWPALPRAREFLDMVEQQGMWRGHVELGDEGKRMEWRVDFGKKRNKVVAFIETSGDFGHSQHLVHLQPLFDNDNFLYGFFGTLTDKTGLRAEYLLINGKHIMKLLVLHHMGHVLEEDLVLKFRVPLELSPSEDL